MMTRVTLNYYGSTAHTDYEWGDGWGDTHGSGTGYGVSAGLYYDELQHDSGDGADEYYGDGEGGGTGEVGNGQGDGGEDFI